MCTLRSTCQDDTVPLQCNTEKDKGKSRQRTAGTYMHMKKLTFSVLQTVAYLICCSQLFL